MQGVRQVVLANRAGMSKQAIGQLIAEIQALKYVELAPDPDDARAKIVCFTKRGMALREAELHAKQELRAILVGACGIAKIDELIREMVLTAEILTEYTIEQTRPPANSRAG
jgi:DNA-binding MarR family transcriptional regulator